jgi:hypothetical protein
MTTKTIIERIKTLESVSDAPLCYWFSGAFDSNQTSFETQSNHGKICVLARDRTAALLMLVLLRHIIDNRDFDVCEYENENYLEHSSIELLFLSIAESEDNYVSNFPVTQKEISIPLTSGPAVLNPIVDTDVWTLTRLERNTV